MSQTIDEPVTNSPESGVEVKIAENLPKSGLSWKTFRQNAILVPFDILVILFVAQSMIPMWAALLLAFVNFGTWWCYYSIPKYLRTTSGQDGRSILIPGSIVESFAKFIACCGLHHRAHYGLMFAMMAGFHAAMNGSLWNLPITGAQALALAWVSYALLLAIDFRMFWVSLVTVRELKKDKLTEANDYTADLERSNEDLEQFAYIASHDLRSPLRAMQKLTTWIAEDVGPDPSPKLLQNIDLLQQRVGRLDNLLEDLLQYSRIGRDENKAQFINLQALAREIFMTVRSKRTQKYIATGPRLWIKDYEVAFVVLFSNLINNALKHNPDANAEVHLDLKSNDGNLIITVDDNGPGIDPAYRERIFEVFTTLERRDRKEASGMGLAIVKKLVAHKKGKVSVSESPQGGARFTISLPIESFERKELDDDT